MGKTLPNIVTDRATVNVNHAPRADWTIGALLRGNAGNTTSPETGTTTVQHLRSHRR